MILRAALLASCCSLAFVCGCSASSRASIDDPPPCKFENGARLADEVQWFCADFQDVIFGIDYYDHIEARFGEGPYGF